MTQTTNLNLNKFEATDKLNPTTLNGLNSNADIIDGAIGNIETILQTLNSGSGVA